MFKRYNCYHLLSLFLLIFSDYFIMQLTLIIVIIYHILFNWFFNLTTTLCCRCGNSSTEPPWSPRGSCSTRAPSGSGWSSAEPCSSIEPPARPDGQQSTLPASEPERTVQREFQIMIHFTNGRFKMTSHMRNFELFAILNYGTSFAVRSSPQLGVIYGLFFSKYSQTGV